MPASISLEGPVNISNYISNGNSKLPMLIHVNDQAGSPITSGTSRRCPAALYRHIEVVTKQAAPSHHVLHGVVLLPFAAILR